MSAWWASGYDIGTGPKGEPVLALHLGEPTTFTGNQYCRCADFAV